MSDVPNSAFRPPLLFWDVDTQVDFMLPGGKLYVPGAEQILPNLQRLTQFARRQRIPVVASTDAHQPDDDEFRQYPPHCLAGTPGQRKVRETLLDASYIVPNRPIELLRDLINSRCAQVIVEKQKLDVFTNPNVDDLLKQFGRREIVLYGVVTELCVRCAARGLLDRGYRIRLVTDAVRALDEQKSKEFLEEVKRRGGELVNTEGVVRPV